MKIVMLFFSLISAPIALAAPSIYVEATTEYSAYYTRQQAGDHMRSFNGCTTQTIGNIVFEDCSAKIQIVENNQILPPENDKDFRCHFEYQSYNPDFFKILTSVCQ